MPRDSKNEALDDKVNSDDGDITDQAGSDNVIEQPEKSDDAEQASGASEETTTVAVDKPIDVARHSSAPHFMFDDEYSGQGGTFTIDAETGKRVRVED